MKLFAWICSKLSKSTKASLLMEVVNPPLPVIEEIRIDEFPLIFRFLNEKYTSGSLYRGELWVLSNDDSYGRTLEYIIPRRELRLAEHYPIECIPALTKYSEFGTIMQEFLWWRLKEGA